MTREIEYGEDGLPVDWVGPVGRARTHTRTFNRFLLDGGLPEKVVVRDVTPEGHATKLYAVVADYGWAERILCGDCYLRDANDLAWAVGDVLDISVTEAAA